jgi:hypothetical protein
MHDVVIRFQAPVWSSFLDALISTWFSDSFSASSIFDLPYHQQTNIANGNWGWRPTISLILASESTVARLVAGVLDSHLLVSSPFFYSFLFHQPNAPLPKGFNMYVWVVWCRSLVITIANDAMEQGSISDFYNLQSVFVCICCYRVSLFHL